MLQGIQYRWIRFVSSSISLIERLFYYPVLKKEISKYVNINIKNLIFDIGANRGQSIFFFKKIMKNSEIYSFEPSSQVFRILEKKIAKLQGVYIFNEALGSEVRLRDFYESKLDETSTFKLPNFNSNYHKFKSKVLLVNPNRMYISKKIMTNTLDLKVNELNISKIDLCKIDVEGSEFSVLKGAIGLLMKGKIKVILLERHADDMRQSESEEIYKLLSSLNYEKKESIKHPFGKYYDDIWVVNDMFE